ncbi:tubby-like F-box protein 5 isoform X2 [Camellia sinensis]|uniref:tubby-like F-box protein 5 isoform X2 n=1 Tax=Camellia sinensis TaxID=4442 RepID=UPI0010356017|nr:tubby-like F-box protein 5 isoform X2 [Camellia sinensis]
MAVVVLVEEKNKRRDLEDFELIKARSEGFKEHLIQISGFRIRYVGKLLRILPFSVKTSFHQLLYMFVYVCVCCLLIISDPNIPESQSPNSLLLSHRSGEMSFKSIVRELREMKDGMGSLSKRRVEGKHWCNRTRSHIAPDVAPSEPVEQGKWANLPPELLLNIIRRVEESETTWPARTDVVFCASVCKSWRDTTKEIVKTPEECGRLTFPISLKQPGPRDSPIQGVIKRDRTTSIYLMQFLGILLVHFLE